jgi:hypothetical protein
MDEAERKAIEQRLARILRAIYLSSLAAEGVCTVHARRVHRAESGERLRVHACELRDRRHAAGCLLAGMGRGVPLARFLLWPVMWCWGHLTAFTGAQFSLHMLGNMEAKGAKLTEYAQSLARELSRVEAVESLVQLQRAEAARRAFIVARLEET